MLKSKTLLCATVAFLPLLSSTSVWAAADDQETATSGSSAQAGADEGGLGEITVTAQRRSQNLQDVPLAVTVLSAEGLANANVTQFSDLTKMTPSLNLAGSATPLESAISVRGVGTYAFGIGIERSVAILIDDVPVAVQSQAFTNLSDVAQIEVLRGPQSTLFGKSAIAGAINIKTLASSKELSGRIEALATTDDEQRLTATISAPLTTTLGFRLTGEVNHFRGTLHNIENDSWVNGRKEYSIKGRVDWEPTENFTASIKGHYNRVDSSCCTWAPAFIDGAARFRGAAGVTAAVIYPGITIDRNNNKTRLDAPVVYNSRDKGGSIHLNYDFGPASLISVTSYEDFYGLDKQDQDNSAYDTLGLATGGVQHGSITSTGITLFEQFTQEFRLVSPSTGNFRYLVGAYYSHNTSSRSYVRGPVLSVSNNKYFTGSDVYAVFGQTELDLTPEFTVVTGLRYTSQRVSGRISNFRNNTSFPLPGGSDNSTDDAVTGKASVQYRPSAQVMVYASYARGYKGEAYDLGNSTTAAIYARQPVRAETANAYEIGAKTTLFDNHLVFNVAGFWTDFKDFQTQQVEPGLGGSFVIANVGSLRTRGVEVDAQLRFGGLTVGAGVTYLDALIRSFPQAGCYTGQTAATGCVGGFQNLAGKRLNNAPTWKTTLDVNYARPLGDGAWEAVLGGSFNWVSETQFGIENNPALVQGAYGIFNIRAGLNQGEKGFAISAFVDNLFNEHYYSGLGTNPYFSGGTTIVGYLPRDFGRYGGLKASYRF